MRNIFTRLRFQSLCPVRAIIPLVSAMQKLYCRETRKAMAVNDRSRNGGQRVHRPGVYRSDVLLELHFLT